MHITKEYLQLEPIGLVFVFFFALILVIQFIAMLFHRFGTVAHILAATELNFFFCKKKVIIINFFGDFLPHFSIHQLLIFNILDIFD